MGVNFVIGRFDFRVEYIQSVLNRPRPGGPVLCLALNVVTRPIYAYRGLEVQCSWPCLTQGGKTALEGWLQAHPKAQMVIIDGLSLFEPLGGVCLEKYYRVMTTLDRLANLYGVQFYIVSRAANDARRVRALARAKIAARDTGCNITILNLGDFCA